MNRLRLEMDALVVESFATATRADATGTVRGREDGSPEPGVGEVEIFAPVPKTADVTCPNTCKLTCGTTCQASCDTCYQTCATGCSCLTLPCAGCV